MATRTRSRASLAAAVSALADAGRHTLLVTSTTPGEGRSRVVAEAGRALAETGRESVLLIDADHDGPSLGKAFGLQAPRGLSELLEETYLFNILDEDPLQFGLGDWLEILRAQRRTGELEIREDGHAHSVRIVKGSIYCIAGSGRRLGEILTAGGQLDGGQIEHALRIQQDNGRPLGQIVKTLRWVSEEQVAEALREQFHERLAPLLALRQPECRFAEMAEAHLPASGGRGSEGEDAQWFDELVFGTMRDYLKRPFLASQIPSYFSETFAPNLKVLTAGRAPYDLTAPTRRRALALLLAHLARLFDVVLVDAPAVTRDGVAPGLARDVDGVLLVVRARGAELGEIRRAVETLRAAGGDVAGVILDRPAGGAVLAEEGMSHEFA